MNRCRKGVYRGSGEQKDELNAGDSRDVQSIDQIP